ncbi:hypothetical protein AALP_AA4G213800 [Arabis alpina]|uniref:Gem-associated protein 2 n=1 Tax=Arabis alpina TaxID=50452 RepID=A0A087H4Q4_ARAAL|nr:hypothetical protein AALP_AA4G213800 [Arabis alpina]
MSTRSDSGDSSPAKASTGGEEFTENSLKTDSVEEMSPKSAPFTSVSEKVVEITQSDSAQVSFSEPEAMIVDSPKALSLPEAASTFLQEPSASNVSLPDISKETDQFGEDDDTHKVEEVVIADGSVVSISETQGFDQESLISEKKEQGCDDVHRLLEEEKRRLLAEIEAGSVFMKKEDLEKLTSDFHKIVKNNVTVFKEHHEKKERVRVKDNAFVGRSLKIELVDDTALLNVFPFYKKGKDHHPKRPGTSHTDKDAPRKHKKTGKGNVSEFQNRGEMNGKKMYSRKQMESMRFANVANQKKLWSEMYARLLPELVSEYEGLVNLKNQKTSKANLSGNGILDTKEGMDDLTLEEEEYTEDNDDYNSILRPAFAVDGEPDFDSGPPEDGLEYLRRVRWEAKQIPNVRVAKIDESNYIKKEQSVYMPQIPEIPKCPEHLLPVKEWEDSLLSDFLDLRLALSENVDNGEDEIMSSQSTEYVLMGIFSKRLHTVTDESFSEVVSEIQGMDSVTRVSKLKKRICLVENESGLVSSDFKWVVALCASVDTPLDADTCASLRSLLRKCASLRASEVEDEQVIIMANMLITIAGRFFGQME